MNKIVLKMLLSVLAMLAGIVITNGIAYAKTICYQSDLFTSERFVLDIQRFAIRHIAFLGGGVNNFNLAKQKAFAVHGKEVGICGQNTIAAVTGTIVVGKSFETVEGAVGAHMGLKVHASRGDGLFGGDETCRSIEVDCTTEEEVAFPETWTCESRNGFDVYHGIYTLTKVKKREDPLCNIFQEAQIETKTSSPEDAGPASGMPWPSKPAK